MTANTPPKIIVNQSANTVTKLGNASASTAINLTSPPANQRK
nr:hypothetical protein [Vibrio mediterranei]